MEFQTKTPNPININQIIPTPKFCHCCGTVRNPLWLIPWFVPRLDEFPMEPLLRCEQTRDQIELCCEPTTTCELLCKVHIYSPLEETLFLNFCSLFMFVHPPFISSACNGKRTHTQVHSGNPVRTHWLTEKVNESVGGGYTLLTAPSLVPTLIIEPLNCPFYGFWILFPFPDFPQHCLSMYGHRVTSNIGGQNNFK